MEKNYNYKLYSEAFDSNYFTLSAERLKKVISLIDEKEGKMLDVGCGDGTITRKIADAKKFQAFGIELVEKNVKKAKEKKVNAKKCDLLKEKIPFPENYFDFVYSGEFLEHIIAPEEALQQIYRVLKPGKEVIITVPNTAAWYNRILLLFGFLPYWVDSGSKNNYGVPYGVACGHLKAFNKRAIKRMIEEEGFKVKKIVGSAVNPKGKHTCKREQAGIKIFYLLDKIFSNIPTMASNIIIKAEK
jgi:methionine biosynthesis protein MetW